MTPERSTTFTFRYTPLLPESDAAAARGRFGHAGCNVLMATLSARAISIQLRSDP
jgi:hypothetical protein